MKKVMIYGRENCLYCSKAKELSEANGIPFDWVDVTEGDRKQELLALVPNAKTVPQIFVNGVHVGGFTEYEEYVTENLHGVGDLR